VSRASHPLRAIRVDLVTASCDGLLRRSARRDPSLDTR